MSFFFGSPKPSSNSSFGYKLMGDAGLPRDLENLKGNIVTANKKYREELTKYREVAKFNQQLSTSYVRNLEAMVDVSRILNYYVEIFSLFKEEFEKNEALIGTSLKTSDISYLERLTRSKLDELNSKFIVETDKLKKIYSQYGRQEELSRVNEAQSSLRSISDGAETTMASIRSIEERGINGGAAARKTAQKMPRFAHKLVLKAVPPKSNRRNGRDHKTKEGKEAKGGVAR